jgi:dipeptidyl aminopeptidase/acylaminoacyl peptidase
MGIVILDDRYILRQGSYVVDLATVDFLTWKKDDDKMKWDRDGQYFEKKSKGYFWVKMHIGTKEARFICKDKSELIRIIKLWTGIHGKEVKVGISDLDEYNEQER